MGSAPLLVCESCDRPTRHTFAMAYEMLGGIAQVYECSTCLFPRRWGLESKEGAVDNEEDDAPLAA